jgi:hypothetical protein
VTSHIRPGPATAVYVITITVEYDRDAPRQDIKSALIDNIQAAIGRGLLDTSEGAVVQEYDLDIEEKTGER